MQERSTDYVAPLYMYPMVQFQAASTLILLSLFSVTITENNITENAV